MKKLAVFFADGMEELEGLTPVDILRRCDDVEVTTFSVGAEVITTSHGVKIIPDKSVKDIIIDEFDGVIIPGGMPGALNISNNAYAVNAIKKAQEQGRLVSAICASPAVVLAGNGLFKGRKLTCYPAPKFIESLSGYEYTASAVEIDKNLITANGPKSAFAFAMAICEYFNLTPNF